MLQTPTLSLCVATLLVVVTGCTQQEAEKVSPTPSQPAAVSIQEEADSPKVDAQAPSAGQVHQARPGMGMAGTKPALPSGHPPIAGKLPQGHPPVQGNLPQGHPPIPGSRAPQKLPPAPPTDGNPLPLATGPFSPAEDLKQGLTTLQDESDKNALDRAFRLTFTLNRAKRGYNEAGTLLLPVLKKHPKHPQALRTMGYVAVNQGFNFKKAIEFYTLAVEADESYGHAHYALAFMHARGDREIGATHYTKAMKLGVPDARGIGRSFYPHLVKNPAAALPKNHP